MSLADVQSIDTSMEQDQYLAAHNTAEQSDFSLSKMDTRPESNYEVKAMSLAFAVFLYHSKRKCQ